MMTQTPEINPVAPAPPREIPERPSRILVADDEYLVAVELTTWLAERGYTTVGPVGSGSEAVRLARSARPDLALLDVRMPNGDGLEAAAILMEELSIPVVMVTAYAEREYVRIAERAGVFAYLVKPAEPEQLGATIDIAWGRYRRFMEERGEREDLRRRLDERKVVEHAKWLLVERTGIDEPTAMRMLQARARRERQKLITIAHRVIQNGDDLREEVQGARTPRERPGPA